MRNPASIWGSFLTEFLHYLIFFLAFLIGSIPFGLLIARAFKVKDLTARGSGNIGATNVTRVLGFWPAGALTFLLDFLKGFLPVFLAGREVFQGIWSHWLGSLDFGDGGVEFSANTIWAIGAAAVIGHCYSPWLKFKGGKGVATGVGALFALSPLAALGGMVGFGLSFWEKKLGSLASLTGLILASIVHLALFPVGAHLWFGGLMISIILIRHESNIDALLLNQEKSLV